MNPKSLNVYRDLKLTRDEIKVAEMTPGAFALDTSNFQQDVVR